ncbi:hypothetical protein M407DRAFT_27219 [Tulasnella calospora MUT 4182]|uniref:Peptidase C14 caspase domain-containing protein n=1 Tax=Tulasnella calospora MUT 4182 TaxID=1051891 RepID=A0A0C3QEA6_9AGAM|nr:hypothetical protein M407DRAFT_27219 [Tulasnella calospora MUT 4182]
MTLSGPKSDLKLMLKHLEYRHQGDDRQFVIITDFNPEPFEDADGVSRRIPFIPATRQAIEQNVRRTLRNLNRRDKCLVYYSGHIDLNPSTNARTGTSDAFLVIDGNARIYDYEFRSWFSESRHQSTTIISVFDACHSGGFLGLPYLYEDPSGHASGAVVASNLPTRSEVVS